MTKTSDIKSKLKANKKTPILSCDLLSTGSVLLNLACSGNARGGFSKGRYFFLVGDSASGKTFLALTTLAEASINPEFKDYHLVFNNAEDGALMDTERFFGSKLKERITPRVAHTVEEFYDDVMSYIDKKEPFIYVLDSMDALIPQTEVALAQSNRRARASDKKESASYGTAKAKANSSSLPHIVSGLRDTGSILVIISQTRDNIGFGAQFNPKTRSGGKALRFYATLELWFSVKESIKRAVRGKTRKIGSVLQVQVKKNRQVGREPKVDLHFYPSLGFDDLGSLVDFLIEEKHWKGTEGKVSAEDFDYSGSKEGLIQKIQEENAEDELIALVGRVWQEIEQGCQVERKSRYGC